VVAAAARRLDQQPGDAVRVGSPTPRCVSGDPVTIARLNAQSRLAMAGSRQRPSQRRLTLKGCGWR
jgi:hypothetical protein